MTRHIPYRIRELEPALAEMKTLHGLLPICGYCHSIRNEANYWQRVEEYISHHSALRFSHGICPKCWDSVVVPELAALEITPAPQMSADVRTPPVVCNPAT